jgi:hypothetical protein
MFPRIIDWQKITHVMQLVDIPTAMNLCFKKAVPRRAEAGVKKPPTGERPHTSGVCVRFNFTVKTASSQLTSDAEPKIVRIEHIPHPI